MEDERSSQRLQSPDVITWTVGDEYEILGFKPVSEEIIRIPETRRKIDKDHPEVDQDKIDEVYREYRYQSISRSDLRCLERFKRLDGIWHVVVVKFREDWNKLLTFHIIRSRDLLTRIDAKCLVDKDLKLTRDDEIIQVHPRGE